MSLEVIALPTGKIVFKVVDDMDQPVSDAKVSASFYGEKYIVVKGSTGSEGLFVAEEDTSGLVRYGAEKEGYYLTTGELDNFKKVSGIKGFRRWEPWGVEEKIILKKIKKPIALYAIPLVSRDIPVLDRFIGFDLIERDWVVPYGKGLNTDFLFKVVQRRAVHSRDYDVDLVVRFPSPQDGIISAYGTAQYGSKLRLPHHAPLNSYDNELVINKKVDPNIIYSDGSDGFKNSDTQNYFFRIRSEVDEKGKLTGAHYGKIHGLIELLDFYEKGMTGKVKFTYYLNPTKNDTNLEFDYKQNLFGKWDVLSVSERVSQP